MIPCSYLLYFSAKTGKGFQVPYPAITLHAISRSSDRPSIYCQIEEPGQAENGAEAPSSTAPRTNGSAPQVQGGEDNDAEEGEDDDADNMREMHIIPAQSDSRKSDCYNLHLPI